MSQKEPIEIFDLDEDEIDNNTENKIENTKKSSNAQSSPIIWAFCIVLIFVSSIIILILYNQYVLLVAYFTVAIFLKFLQHYLFKTNKRLNHFSNLFFILFLISLVLCCL